MKGGRQRAPGVWEIRVPLPRDTVTGKRLTLSRTVHGNERKAIAERNKLLRSVATGEHVGTPATVGELLDRWIAQVADDYSPTTVREYRNFIRHRLKPALGEIQLRRLTTDTLDEYYRRLTRKEGLAPATARKAHAVMHMALGQAVRWRWIRENPADRATPPRLRGKEIALPTPEAIDSVLLAAMEADPALGTFLAFTAASGCRRGEVCGLRRTELALDEEVPAVAITGAVIELAGGATMEKETKTHRARVFALDPFTVQILRDHLERMDKRAADEGTSVLPDAFVFSRCLQGCHPWRPNYVTKTFIKLRDRLGLPTLRLHDFRHFSSSMLLGNKVDAKTIAERHGWANANMLFNRYGHSLTASDVEAARVMGQVLYGHRQPAPTATEEP